MPGPAIMNFLFIVLLSIERVLKTNGELTSS